MPGKPRQPRPAAVNRSRSPRPSTTRKHSRFAVSLPVRCTRLIRGAPKTWRGRTADVSGGGTAVLLPTRLPPGTHVAIEVRTAIGPMRVEAEVLWTRRVPERPGLVRHGLCMADRSEVFDLPIGVLLGQWLRSRMKRAAATGSRTRTGKRTPGQTKRRP
jgi:hypothetical protein